MRRAGGRFRIANDWYRPQYIKAPTYSFVLTEYLSVYINSKHSRHSDSILSISIVAMSNSNRSMEAEAVQMSKNLGCSVAGRRLSRHCHLQLAILAPFISTNIKSDLVFSMPADISHFSFLIFEYATFRLRCRSKMFSSLPIWCHKGRLRAQCTPDWSTLEILATSEAISRPIFGLPRPTSGLFLTSQTI
jgi:hypothetical protein